MQGGISLIAAGGLLSALVVAGLWRRAPRALTVALLAACGVLVGTGALLVQDRVTAAEWVITLVTLGVLTPVHATLVFREWGRTP